jgi:hypothetical protein
MFSFPQTAHLLIYIYLKIFNNINLLTWKTKKIINKYKIKPSLNLFFQVILKFKITIIKFFLSNETY